MLQAFSLKTFLAAESRPSPNTYCGVMVYQRLALGSVSASGRTVCSIAPKVGTDQRNVAALQSLPVISSAPAVVMKMPPVFSASLPMASDSEDRMPPAKKRVPCCCDASCTLRTAVAGLPSVSSTV